MSNAKTRSKIKTSTLSIKPKAKSIKSRKAINLRPVEEQKKIRYAIVGLGHIAQVAMLPAFKHASENSELVAFVSDDQDKIKELSKKYKVKQAWTYDAYEDCLKSGEVDAVYIALPNNMHEEFAIKAANAGIHVLCEKPMAPTEEACQKMIEAARKNHIKLMIAYRLHFDEANMSAVHMVESGKIGIPKSFHSVFTMQVREGNIRTKHSFAGGPLYDIGIYCINAARYIFKSEPIEVFALASKGKDKRFEEIDEICSAIMRFPDNKLATFTCSFGANSVSQYQVIGTTGNIMLDPAYEYAEGLKYKITINGKTQEKQLTKSDQFAPELIHFSQSILENKTPQPSGEEGLADIHIINAIQESLAKGFSVKVKSIPPISRPDKNTIIKRPPVQKPVLIKVKSASRD